MLLSRFVCVLSLFFFFFFFFNDTATTEIYTLSLHDALPIYAVEVANSVKALFPELRASLPGSISFLDRKSTRLNSSHTVISYAVFCLKKKKKTKQRKITKIYRNTVGIYITVIVHDVKLSYDD